mgnify:CR=1 FL=1
MTPQELDAIAITLTTGETPRLIFSLQGDFLQRMGDGSAQPDLPDMFQGPAPAQLLTTLAGQVDPELLVRSRSLRVDEGQERTVLVLRFEGAGEVREVRFDSVSSAPPPSVQGLVAAAVALTERWYAQQASLSAL